MPVTASDLAPATSALLNIDGTKGRRVAEAFERFVAIPLAQGLSDVPASSIARRNPFVYAALGASSVDTWVDRVVADKLTSMAEGLIGNFLEEVARILADGTKPGSGVDLQRDVTDEDVEIFAIQSTTNTKNAGGRRSDLQGLDKAAGALRAQRRHVSKFVAYLFGRKITTKIGDVTHLSSEDFWQRISGQAEFLPLLLKACVLLSPLYLEKVTAGTEKLQQEAREEYGDMYGNIDYQRVFRPAKKKTAKQ